MKIVLAAIHASPAHHSLALPLLQAYLAERLPEVRVVPLEFSTRRDAAEIAFRVAEEKPDVVGFSCSIWNVDLVRRGTLLLRSLLPGAKILFGGPEIAGDLSDWFSDPGAPDAVISGEGEGPFAAFLSGLLEDPASHPSPPGVLRADAPVSSFRPAEPLDPALIPSPFLGGFVAADRPFLYWETSRGCRFQCTFCLSSLDRGVRNFPLDRVEAELDWFVRNGVPLVRVIDRTFNDDSRRAASILESILRKTPPSMRFHFEIDGYRIDDDFLDVCRRAPPGKFQFEVGVQSLRREVLREIRRPTRTESLLRNMRRIAAETRVSLHVDLIFGLPKQTASSFDESLETLVELRPAMLQIEALKLLRGTEARARADLEGWLRLPWAPYRVLETPWMSRREVNAAAEVARAVDLFRNPAYLREAADALARLSGSPARFWRRLGKWWADYERSAGRRPIEARVRFRVLDRFLREQADLFPEARLPFAHDLLRFAYYALEPPHPGILRHREPPVSMPLRRLEEALREGTIRAGRIRPATPGDPNLPDAPPRPPTEDPRRHRLARFLRDPTPILEGEPPGDSAGPALFLFVYPRPDDPFHTPVVFRLTSAS